MAYFQNENTGDDANGIHHTDLLPTQKCVRQLWVSAAPSVGTLVLVKVALETAENSASYLTLAHPLVK